MDKKPSIFGYTSYRQYLQDFFEYKKSKDYGYSYRQFSKSAGFSSVSVLPSILSGRRNLSIKSIPKFVSVLQLNAEEKKYFILLVKMNNEKNVENIDKYFQELTAITPSKSKKQLSDEHFQYLSHWIYPLLEELVNFEDFKEDFGWVKSILYDSQISDQEISSALLFLKRTELVVKNESGKYSATGKILTFPGDRKNLNIRRFHRMIMDQAKKLHEVLNPSEREYATITLCVPKSEIAEIKKKISDFKSELLEKYTGGVEKSSDSSTITQLNIQFFRHSK
ncbi:MAG: TIGR02147 family protein [Oligoflexales bacterium]|nr:TIGR02147 family protein [Oligoflexales bacterium]